MYGKAWNGPSRDILEQITVISGVKVQDPNTLEFSYVQGIPVTYWGTKIQLSSLKEWTPTSELVNSTIQVRIFEPLEEINASTRLKINGVEYIIDGTPVIASQPAQRRKKMTKIFAHKSGKENGYSSYA
jgi:hypothetical protein